MPKNILSWLNINKNLVTQELIVEPKDIAQRFKTAHRENNNIIQRYYLYCGAGEVSEIGNREIFSKGSEEYNQLNKRLLEAGI